MSKILIEKLRKSRQRNIDCDGYTFTVRRPTDMEMLGFRGKKIQESDILSRFVVGWNIKESDILPGGTDADVEFTSDLFMEWVADKPSLWVPICTEIMGLYSEHEKEMEDALGKQDAG
jgi:hypothetical protein